MFESRQRRPHIPALRKAPRLAGDVTPVTPSQPGPYEAGRLARDATPGRHLMKGAYSLALMKLAAWRARSSESCQRLRQTHSELDSCGSTTSEEKDSKVMGPW
eukprot:362294-Chlamydomonas_euryale.AAC.6